MLNGWERLSEEEQSRIADSVISGRAPGGPWHLEIHLTNDCNSNCFFCNTRERRHGESLPWPLLESALEQEATRNLRFLRLCGGGEPLIYGQMDELLELCARLELRPTDVTTNGILLKEFSQKLVDVGSTFVSVSLNESNPDRHASTMMVREEDFHRAVEGVKALCAARDAAPVDRKPIVRLQLMVWRKNHQFLDEMYAFALGLGVDRIFFRGIDFLPDSQRIPPEEREGLRRRLREVIEEDSRPGRFRLRFDLSPEGDLNRFALQEQRRLLPPDVRVGPDFVVSEPRREYCFMPWYSATIGASGRVYPCCIFQGMADKEMGDLGSRTFGEIWRGEPFGRLRKEMRQLMLLRGKMEHSRRFLRYVDRSCIENFGCIYSFCLCSPEFYGQLSRRLETESPPLARALATARNGLLRAVHRLRR